MNLFTSLIIQYYQSGVYSDKDLPDFIACGWLTTEQYKQMTGKDYQAPATT